MFGGIFGDRLIVRFLSKVAMQSVTVVLATLIGGYVLTALNLRGDDAGREAAPSATDERALTREYVKSLREGRGTPEDVAEVRPIVPAGTQGGVHETVVTKGAPGEAAVISRSGPASIRKENLIRTDMVAMPPELPPALGEPIVLVPAGVASVDDDPRAVRPRTVEPTGVGAVFSTLSTILGGAANATGDSINFMIDLPARTLGRKPVDTAAPALEAPPSDRSAAPPLRFAGS